MYLPADMLIKYQRDDVSHRARDVVATLNQRQWRWFNVVTTSCALAVGSRFQPVAFPPRIAIILSAVYQSIFTGTLWRKIWGISRRYDRHYLLFDIKQTVNGIGAVGSDFVLAVSIRAWRWGFARHNTLNSPQSDRNKKAKANSSNCLRFK